MPTSSVVIIRDPAQVHAGLRVVNTMIQSGQRVSVLLLCGRSGAQRFRARELAGFVQGGAACFVCGPAAEVPGFRETSVAAVARVLADADFVVPFP